MIKSVQGYIVEADQRGFFYHRSGTWVSYQTAAQGYVWTNDEVASIYRAAKDWAIKPSFAHPAVYDDATGVTVLIGTAEKIDHIKGDAVDVPSTGGALFDLRSVAHLGKGTIIAMASSL